MGDVFVCQGAMSCVVDGRRGVYTRQPGCRQLSDIPADILAGLSSWIFSPDFPERHPTFGADHLNHYNHHQPSRPGAPTAPRIDGFLEVA